MNNIDFEIDILNSIGELLDDLLKKMSNSNIKYDIELNRSGEKLNYFSEVEVTIWKDDNILDALSVIICINGQLRNTKEEFLSWFIDEINKIFEPLTPDIHSLIPK